MSETLRFCDMFYEIYLKFSPLGSRYMRGTIEERILKRRFLRGEINGDANIVTGGDADEDTRCVYLCVCQVWLGGGAGACMHKYGKGTR